MRGSLSVRVTDRDVTRIVTSRTRDLRFRKTAPGGHHSASCRLILPRDTFRDLGPADRLYIYDSRTARTIWEGYTENPGVTDGSGGQEFDLTAMGGMVLASDQAFNRFYVGGETGGPNWEKYLTAASATAEATAVPNGSGDEGLVLQFNPGQPVATGAVAALYNRTIRVMTGQKLGRFQFNWAAGKTDANYVLEAITKQGTGGAPTTVRSQTLSSGGGGYSNKVVVTDFPNGDDVLYLQLRRTGGATNVADDTTWVAVTNLQMNAVLLQLDGTERLTGYFAQVSASAVMEDVVAFALANVVDTKVSTVESTPLRADRLSYMGDAVRASQIFDDILMLEPDYLWEILESGTSGKHRFNFRAWPTTPRYEISVRDGYNAPGGEVDLCNRIAVSWTDPKGRAQTTVVTQTVDALGSRIRDAEPVTLPDGLGSLANAQRIGAQVLASKVNPPKAATAVVKRPILDRLTGMTVMPWEIEPGYLVRVRETGDDLRLTEMEYVDQDCSASLTLGTPVRSLEQMVADLSRSR